MQISRSQFLKYTILPGILPRIYGIFASGFVHVPYFIAVIYQAAGILPRGHAYLNPRNIGRYGVWHVIVESANHLVIDRKHIDQVIIFLIILAGAVLLVLQVLLLFATLLFQKQVFALATPAQLFGPFSGAASEQDLAFIMLDHVFGLKNFFYSCISTSADCLDLRGRPLPDFGIYPTPFHTALHALLRFYSLGIFVISVFVIIYFVIAVTAETAASGTAFGQRFNKVWVPVRLILCFALLMPLNTGGDDKGAGTGVNAGLNAAQLITLYAAKLGSNFATNAWNRFNATIVDGYLGNTTSLVASPNAPKINDLVKFMFLVKTCKIAENMAYDHQPNGVQAWLVREKQLSFSMSTGADARSFATASFANAKAFSNNGNIFVRFGTVDPVENNNNKGGVIPLCGEVRITVSSLDGGGPITGGSVLQKMYYDMVKKMWNDPDMAEYASCMRARNSQIQPDPDCTQVPDQTFLSAMIDRYQTGLQKDIDDAVAQQVVSGAWTVNATLAEKGWVGAGIWYNRIAQMNGDIATAAMDVPLPSRFPFIMEFVTKQRRANNANLTPETAFDPELAEGQDLDYPRKQGLDREIAALLNKTYMAWQESDTYDTETGSQGPVIDTVNAIFGTSGIFSMRRNANVHPLAQLSVLGRGMMGASVRNFTGGMGLGLVGGAAKGFNNFVGMLGTMAGDFMKTVGLATMAMSFVLYYVIPFMPFIYFMFAAGGWLKAIFEAIVAMPLWALAHIRIDGEGMPGSGATQGYYLILEIFLRPILIVFGLLASIQIFSALVAVLNDIFSLVTANLSGFDREAELTGIGTSFINFARGPIDELFFTVIYVIMCYMIGLGCFKLIDFIPNTIMRWIGVSVSPLVGQEGDSAGNVVSQTYQGATLATGQVTSGGQLAALLGSGRGG